MFCFFKKKLYWFLLNNFKGQKSKLLKTAIYFVFTSFEFEKTVFSQLRSPFSKQHCPVINLLHTLDQNIATYMSNWILFIIGRLVGDHSDKSPCLLLQKRVGIQGCLNMAKVKNDSTLMDHSIDNKELSMQNDLEILLTERLSVL